MRAADAPHTVGNVYVSRQKNWKVTEMDDG